MNQSNVGFSQCAQKKGTLFLRSCRGGTDFTFAGWSGVVLFFIKNTKTLEWSAPIIYNILVR